MKHIEKHDIRFYLTYGLFFFFILVLPSILVIRDCVKEEERKPYREKIKAQYDSIKREEARREEQLIKEITLRRVQFYERYSTAYHHFNDFDEFNTWLYEANRAGFELLYKNYRARYREWPGGIDSLSRYLGWGGPVYYVECKQCGYETEYHPED